MRPSVQANFTFQFQRFFGIAQIGWRYVRRFQFAEWLEPAIRFHAFVQRVFGGGLGDHALAFFAGHVGEQLLGLLGMLAGLEHGSAGYGDQTADVAAGEIVQLGVELAFLPLQGEPVVVVHQNSRHFAVFHSLQGDHVVAVGLAEGTQAGQPFLGGFAAAVVIDRLNREFAKARITIGTSSLKITDLK